MNIPSDEILEQARVLATANDNITEYDLMDTLDIDFETASSLIEILQNEGKIKKVEIKTQDKPTQNKAETEAKDTQKTKNIEYYTTNKNKDNSIYIVYLFLGSTTVLSFFNSMMYFYSHLQLWFIFALPLCFLVAALSFIIFSFFLKKICLSRYLPIITIAIVLPFSVCTYFMYNYTENLKIENAIKKKAERIEKEIEYKSNEYAKKDCDKQGAQEAIDMIVNGGLAERQNNPDSVIVWYIWKDNWYGFSQEQRYQLTSGIGGAEKCLTGKAIRIRVGNRDVAKATLTGDVELID